MRLAAQSIYDRLRRPLIAGTLARNVSWLMGAEMVSRLGRIATAIILARTLDAVAFGIAALALTIFELTRVLTENGIGAAVIRASNDKLQATANTAHRLMWFICCALAVVQSLVGLGAATLLDRSEMGWMVVALAGVYLIMPFGLVHAYILQRQERMKRLSFVFASQSVADHALTAMLALSGFGPWAIVLPKLLTAPVWLVGVRYGHPWRREVTAGVVPVRSILIFSIPVLLSEVSVAAREQLDKLLVSALFGLEILGLYYFAFNAGLGLSTALNRAFNGALYPFLCRSAETGKDLREEFRTNLSTTGIVLIAMYVVQAAAALIYVPIIFGQDWTFAAPVVALLCLTGPARLLADGVRVYWRAAGNTLKELRASFIFALSLLLAIPVTAPWGLTAVIISMIIVASLGAGLLIMGAVCPQRLSQVMIHTGGHRS